MNRKRILISGGGIAGLTLAIQLTQAGFDPLLIEREGGLRREGYMIDFFGTGWDVAERMGLTAKRGPCLLDRDLQVGTTARIQKFKRVDRVAHGAQLAGNYVYVRRGDLERILADRAHDAGV